MAGRPPESDATNVPRPTSAQARSCAWHAERVPAEPSPPQRTYFAASSQAAKKVLICSITTPCRTLNVLSTAVADHAALLAMVVPPTLLQLREALVALPFSNVTTGSMVKVRACLSLPSFVLRWQVTSCLPILASYLASDAAATNSLRSSEMLASHCAWPKGQSRAPLSTLLLRSMSGQVLSTLQAMLPPCAVLLRAASQIATLQPRRACCSL